MTRITIDKKTRAKLNGLHDHAVLCDDTGRTIGYFLPSGLLRDVSPYSEEEIERRRQKRSGRSLDEILRDLETQGWTT